MASTPQLSAAEWANALEIQLREGTSAPEVVEFISYVESKVGGTPSIFFWCKVLALLYYNAPMGYHRISKYEQDMYDGWIKSRQSKEPQKQNRDSINKAKAISALKALTPDELGEVLDIFLLINDGTVESDKPVETTSSSPQFTFSIPHPKAIPSFPFIPKAGDYSYQPSPGSCQGTASSDSFTAAEFSAKAFAEAMKQAKTKVEKAPQGMKVPALPFYSERGWIPEGEADPYTGKRTAPTTTEATKPKPFKLEVGMEVIYKGAAKSEPTKARILSLEFAKAVVKLGEDQCAYRVKKSELFQKSPETQG